ncbi:3-oxoacyl-ACP reductase FabG [Streptomyces physcomitrii]|uniref:3-oxoacyl-ACP reductase FabG n=1 Tax=Streptomyces physcomitrii TaxID=2724184 RepID=A0ABX1H4A9_9ACTN|nr:3-oxoacyl-ACP reductase FabG [Streptomyces physcomitrii]NKI41866.1 3-oxoacyl-ACP reductase FabG [Streptomyces physcomitrii]
MSRPLALVSGGSRGIGRAVVVRLAQDGYDVAFCYRTRTDAAQEAAEEARQAGARTLATRLDVADGPAVRAFVAEAVEEFGAPAAVVTAAGIARDRPLALMEDAEWESVLRTNLDGTFHLCRAALQPMVRRRAGAFVTISSIAGIHGGIGQTNYAASKAGILGFTRALAKENGRFHIRVNSVAPGLIETDMTAEMPDKAREQHLRRTPLRCLGRPEDVADAVSFLVSDRARFITGEVLSVDGGLTL